MAFIRKHIICDDLKKNHDSKTFWVSGKVNGAGFAFWTEMLWTVIEFVVKVCQY